MNKTISNPKETLLLGAGLDILHFESREWVETINFWKDEIKFFDHLLKKKGSSDESKKEYTEMLTNLDRIHHNLLNDFEDDIRAHEKLLSRLQQGAKGLSDGEYREKHQRLLKKMESFERDFKQFKKVVFNFAKNI